MEKIRRKRINNSLEQLRKLLPYSVNMKKDMASLLEQTVEYINIMHTVLNEDKPACLNKVYLSYRQKTEQIETFRKNFKKTAAKKTKSEPGCSWGQPFGQSSQLDINPFGKHPACMSTSYYDTNCISNPMWQQQKMPDPYLLNQPTYSGQSNNHFLSTAPTSSIHSRSVYYPPSTKHFENEGNIAQTREMHSGDVSKLAVQPTSKPESWQLVSSSISSPQMPNVLSNINSPNDQTNCKPEIFQGSNGEWSHPIINNSPPKLATDDARKTQPEYYDENNNATLPCLDKSEESKSMIETSQCPVDTSKTISSNSHISFTDGDVKCSSPHTNKAVSTPEIYFSSSDANSLCALYGGFGSWNSLPPLSLNPNYLTATTQHQVLPNDINQETSPAQRTVDN